MFFTIKSLVIIQQGQKFKVYGGKNNQTLLYNRFLETMNSTASSLITGKEKGCWFQESLQQFR